MGSRWLRNRRLRRIGFAVAAILFALLSVWPQHYVAEAQLMPQDNFGSLSSALAQGGGGATSLSALIGNKQPIEANATIARSQVVMDDIVNRVRLVGRRGFPTFPKSEAKVRRNLSIIAIPGSILQITYTDYDQEIARAIVGAAAVSIQNRLASLSLMQAAQKRVVATNRLKDASNRLSQAQAAITQFRTVNHLAAPEQQLGAAVGLLASLEGRLQAKQVEIATLSSFTTGQNIQLRAAEAELAALQKQVASAKEASQKGGSQNLESMSQTQEAYYDLFRDEKEAEILYEIFKKYLEQVTVDELSADQTMVLSQPPYVRPERQYNIWAVAMLTIVLLAAFASEFYLLDPAVQKD